MPRFRTDPAIEADGVWLELEDDRIKLARAGENNRAFKEYMAAEHKKVETAMRVGMLSEETATRMLRGAYANTIIRGWETKVDNAWVKDKITLYRMGQFIVEPASVEMYLEFISDPGNADKFKAMRDFATSSAPYAAILLEAEAGN